MVYHHQLSKYSLFETSDLADIVASRSSVGGTASIILYVKLPPVSTVRCNQKFPAQVLRN